MMRLLGAIIASALIAALFTAATMPKTDIQPSKVKTYHYFSPQGWTDVRKAVVT